MKECYLDITKEEIKYSNENGALIPIPVTQEEVEKVQSKYIKMFIREWVHKVLNEPLPRELDLQDY